MRPEKNILFTFDYELFLGPKSGSIAKCVIEPTEKLLDIFKIHKTHAIFFVDTTWLIRLKEVAKLHPTAKKDFLTVAYQLQNIITSGHYVFPHIHPHWLDANYLSDTNQWQLNTYSKYRFHNINTEQRDELFTESINLLKELIEPVKQNYIIDGYRAGGWSIQPFEDFAPYFERYGIKYDFSVLPGKKNISNVQQFDFSDITAKAPYSFSTDVAVQGTGAFVEFPISTIKVSSLTRLFNKIVLKYLWRTNDRYSGDGHSIASETSESDPQREMLAIELLTIAKLRLYNNFLARNNFIQFIAHPKMLSRHNISTFERFMKKAFALYTIETDFKKMLPK